MGEGERGGEGADRPRQNELQNKTRLGNGDIRNGKEQYNVHQDEIKTSSYQEGNGTSFHQDKTETRGRRPGRGRGSR